MLPSSIQALPDDVKRALPDDVDLLKAAYAAIGTAPGTSLGETHMISTPGRLFVYCRASYGAPLFPLALEHTEAPSITVEQFSTWLIFHIDSGPERILLTPFDIAPAERVLTNYHSAMPVAALASTPAPVSAAPVAARSILDAPARSLLDAPAVAAPAARPAPPALDQPPANAGNAGLRGLLDSAKSVGKRASSLANEQVGRSIDRALDLIEFSARRAAERPIKSIRVSVRLNLGLGDVTIEGVFGRDELAALSAMPPMPPSDAE